MEADVVVADESVRAVVLAEKGCIGLRQTLCGYDLGRVGWREARVAIERPQPIKNLVLHAGAR